jgi:hypothetical protein
MKETNRGSPIQPLVAGRFLQAGDSNVMVISESLAGQAKLSVGDTFTLPSSFSSTRFQIVDVIARERCLA